MFRVKNKKVWVLVFYLVALGLFLVPTTGVGQNEVDYLAIGENLMDPALTKDPKGVKDFTVLNLTGQVTTLKQLQQWMDTNEVAKSSLQQPKVVTVIVGYTDLITYLTGGSFTEQQAFTTHYLQQLSKLLSTMKSATKAQIIMGDLYNPLPKNHKQWQSTEKMINELNTELYNLAWKHKIAVAPVYETFSEGALRKRHTLVASELYPNEQGRIAFAQAYQRLVKKY